MLGVQHLANQIIRAGNILLTHTKFYAPRCLGQWGKKPYPVQRHFPFSSQPGGGGEGGLAFRPMIDYSLANSDANYDYFKLTLKIVDVKLDHRNSNISKIIC